MISPFQLNSESNLHEIVESDDVRMEEQPVNVLVVWLSKKVHTQNRSNAGHHRLNSRNSILLRGDFDEKPHDINVIQRNQKCSVDDSTCGKTIEMFLSVAHEPPKNEFSKALMKWSFWGIVYPRENDRWVFFCWMKSVHFWPFTERDLEERYRRNSYGWMGLRWVTDDYTDTRS